MIRIGALCFGILGFLAVYLPFAGRLRAARPVGITPDGSPVVDAALLGLGDVDDSSGFERYVRPLLRTIKPETPLGAALRTRAGDGKIRTMLIRSGNPLRITPFEYFGLQIIGLAAGLVGGLAIMTLQVLPNFVAIGLGVGLGFFGPGMYHKNLMDNRQRDVRREFPEALDLLVITMSSGRNFGPALTEVVGRLPDGLVRTELARVAGEMNGGKAMDRCLLDLAERAPTDGVEAFAKSVVQGEKVGADMVETLKGQSEAARAAYEAAIDSKTAKLNQTLIIPVMVFMVPALLAVLIGPAMSDLASGFGG